MDRISQLPDSLLLRILSSLPTATDIVATMVLSKRWKPLWRSVPKLVYDDSYQNIDIKRFTRFVFSSLILHEAQVETLVFKIAQNSDAVDIGIWIAIATKIHVRDLCIKINCSSSKTPVILPRSLYTGSGMLVQLNLKRVTLVDASSLPSFSVLKTLSLLSVKYPDDEFVRRLLSSCHVLEDLVVEQCVNDNVTIFTVKVPSLKRTSLSQSFDRGRKVEDGFVIDAPSLELLTVFNDTGGYCIVENRMPIIVTADIVVSHCPIEILNSITSVKRLCLCSSYSKDASVGSVFHSLVHLTICTCEIEWLNLFMCVLATSPNLKSLKVEQLHIIPDQQKRPCWNEPSSVPECLLSSLETLEWLKYEGTEEEKEVVAFILRNGSCLKKMTISSKTTDSNKKLEMLKELSLSFRSSPTCQLVFV